MKKQKFYVVWSGRKLGIYKTWAECQEQVDKFEGAVYKAFDNLDDAQTAFNGKAAAFMKRKKSQQVKQNRLFSAQPELNSISVDAAWNTKTKIMEYQGVYTLTKDRIFLQGPYPDATNNIGEFLAIVHALAFLKKKKSTLPVYSDSITAIKWVSDKKANTKLIQTSENAELFEIILRAEKWLLHNKFSNRIIKWDTKNWGEIPADFGRK